VDWELAQKIAGGTSATRSSIEHHNKRFEMQPANAFWTSLFAVRPLPDENTLPFGEPCRIAVFIGYQCDL
jgi:hypothetical protein